MGDLYKNFIKLLTPRVVCRNVRPRKNRLALLLILTTLIGSIAYMHYRPPIRHDCVVKIITAGHLYNANNLSDKFYIYTILAPSIINSSRSDKLYISGWEFKDAKETKYVCCLMFPSGPVQLLISSNKYSLDHDDKLEARQVVCNTEHVNMTEAPNEAVLVTDVSSCHDKTKFHKIKYIYPAKSPSFAICGKIAYGKKDPKYLVEWMEYHKYIGVSKVVIYTYADLHEPARRVLKHYVDEGILETVPMPTVPKLNTFPRYFSVQNSSIMWQDEKVPLFDAEQRLKPYTYVGVIDTDEFIVPKQPGVENLVDLMSDLLRKYETGGTFKMHSEIHVMDWAKTNNDSDLMIEQYGTRTQSMIHDPKFLYVNDRLKEGTVWIHVVYPKPGFSLIDPDADNDVVLKHFRKCKRDWLVASNETVPNKCHGGFQRHRDTLMERVAEKIGPNIRRVKSLLKL